MPILRPVNDDTAAGAVDESPEGRAATDGTRPGGDPRRALGRALAARDDDIVEFCQRKYLSEIYLATLEPVANSDVEVDPVWTVTSIATRAIARWLETGARADSAVRSQIASLGDVAARQRSRLVAPGRAADVSLHRRLARAATHSGDHSDVAGQPGAPQPTATRHILSVAMLTKLNFWWANRTCAVLAEEAARLGTPSALLAEAQAMVVRSSHASVVDMATRFDAELESLHGRLASLALEDPLTGLANRLVLTDRLERALSRQARTGSTLALVFVDVDDFKVVNDVYGHAAGDALLVEIAGRLQAGVRPGDVVARLGGDEFLLLLEDLASPVAEMERRAERLRAAIARPITVGAETLAVTVSVGVALVILPGHRSEEVLARADAAMYVAKRAGRDRVALVELDESPQATHFATASGMHQALERHELRLYYQPVFEARTGAAAGFEALLRWEHPDYGTISPGDFVPIAEKSGLMVPIGEWVLEEACRQAVAWADPLGQTPRMAVNVSARQLDDRDFVRRVARVLERTGMPAERLTLEITETILLAEDAEHMGVLSKLKEIGVLLSIDDFGTGYSSLAYLRRLPVDQLKVDRAFVEDVAEHGDTRVLGAVVRLAHDLGLEVVAEGVETAAELAVVRRLDCDVLQGFLLGRPVPAWQLEASEAPSRRDVESHEAPTVKGFATTTGR